MNLQMIAIDGPAASGKSSTAAAVARQLGLLHVDSGSLYRALTWLALRDGLSEAEGICGAADAAQLGLHRVADALAIRANGREIEAEIRSSAVTAGVSGVAAMPAVRAWVNRRLRAAVEAEGGGVMDGRDIGTVVFPDARLKVFLTATPAARARRRLLQEGKEPAPGAVAAEAAQLAERDRLDAGREIAPLRRADDALLLDTTALDFAAQVGQIVAWARERGLPPA